MMPSPEERRSRCPRPFHLRPSVFLSLEQAQTESRLVAYAAAWASTPGWAEQVRRASGCVLELGPRSARVVSGRLHPPSNGISVLVGIRGHDDPWLWVVDGRWVQLAVHRLLNRTPSPLDLVRPLSESELGAAEFIVLSILAAVEDQPMELLDLARTPGEFLNFWKEPRLAVRLSGRLSVPPVTDAEQPASPPVPGVVHVCLPLTLPPPPGRPQVKRDGSLLRRLRAHLRTLLGRTVLQLEQLDRLQPGDVLFPTERHADVSVHVGHSSRPAFSGRRLGGPALQLENAMPTSEPQPSETTEVIDVLSEIPVDVSLELGRKRLSVSDLLALEPGQVVSFERPLDGPVDLRVGDHRLGRGHLVDIEGRLGVRVEVIYDGGLG
ncbi:MAG: type III secretion system cytoplasmic ring protein SctQ [Myxococcota bacterium]